MVQQAADCLFCKIAVGDVPSTVVRETDRTLAFRDISPQAPMHVLVIPKEHHPTIADLAAADADLAALILVEAAGVASDEGVANRGFRVVFNTGREAGQTVFHAHAHVLGGRGTGVAARLTSVEDWATEPARPP